MFTKKFQGRGGTIFMGENQPRKMPVRKIAPQKFHPPPPSLKDKKKKTKEN